MSSELLHSPSKAVRINSHRLCTTLPSWKRIHHTYQIDTKHILYYFYKLILLFIKDALNGTRNIKYMCHKRLILNKCCFQLCIQQRILEKCIMVNTKIISSTTVLIIDNNNKKENHEHQIRIIEWFMKDHVTLQTGIMSKWYILLYHHWNYNSYLNYNNIFKIFIKCLIYAAWCNYILNVINSISYSTLIHSYKYCKVNVV